MDCTDRPQRESPRSIPQTVIKSGTISYMKIFDGTRQSIILYCLKQGRWCQGRLIKGNVNVKTIKLNLKTIKYQTIYLLDIRVYSSTITN